MFQHNDNVARKTIRVLLIFQLIELIPLAILTLAGHGVLALVIAIFTIFAVAGTLGWLYLRFQSHPLAEHLQPIHFQ